MEPQGIIFDIKKFAIHDGPGIRSTVFLKGCPLSCAWCHNPEGISPRPQVMLFRSRCLAGCRACVPACPRQALTRNKSSIVINRERCDGCGRCAGVCPSDALQMAGRAVRVEPVMAELDKDAAFYQESAGGITFSGGEPLAQIVFLHALLLASKKRGWHTAVDTSGQAPYAHFKKILPLVDLFLFDLKIMDPARHNRFCGKDNALILDNLFRLSNSARSLAIRVPLVHGFNATAAAIGQIADFCASLPRSHAVHILPYHPGGRQKRQRLGQVDPFPGIAAPTSGFMKKAMSVFRERKFTVYCGG